MKVLPSLVCLFATLQVVAENPKSLVEQSGVKGGFVVHLGTKDGERTAELRLNERYQVQGLTKDSSALPAIRKAIAKSGAYGPVSADQFHGGLLPYIDNLVNLIIADDTFGVSDEEFLRV